MEITLGNKYLLALAVGVSPAVAQSTPAFSATSNSLPVAVATPRGEGSITIQRVELHAEEGDSSAGGVYFWKNRSGKWVPLQSLDGINQLLAEASPSSEPEKYRIFTLQILLAEYCRRPDQVFLTGEQRDAYIRQLETKVSKKSADSLRSVVSDLATRWTNGNWEISFFAATHKGEILKYTFSGPCLPVSVKKSATEIIQPAGTIPTFAYISGE